MFLYCSLFKIKIKFALRLSRLLSYYNIHNFASALNIRKYIVEKKSAAVVEGESKAAFSIATIPRCGERRYCFLWIASLYSWSLPYNAER